MTSSYRSRCHRTLSWCIALAGIAVTASAQPFVGSDGFANGSDAKWAYYTRPPGGLADNGMLSFTNGRLDFAKGPGTGGYVLGWDGDPATTASRTSATYSTNWTAAVQATNRIGVLPANEYATVGLEAAIPGGQYYAIMLGRFGDTFLIRVETTGKTVRARYTATAGNVNVWLRLDWDASLHVFKALYHDPAAGVYYLLDTFDPIAAWGLPASSAGFFAEVFANSNVPTAVKPGTIYLDNFNFNAKAAAVPTVTRHPAAQTVPAGSDATLTVEAIGQGELTYQWYKNDVILRGATSPTLTLPAVPVGVLGSFHVLVSNTGGSFKSQAATVTGTPVVSITQQPADRVASVGEAATFTVAVTGAANDPLAYQWRRNGVALAGATGANLALASLTAADFGTYSVLVTSTAGAKATSRNALLTRAAVPAAAPAIERQPQSVIITPGGTLALNVGATGVPEPTYQWSRDGTPIAGATSASLVMNAAPTGEYTVAVTNASGTIVSQKAAVSFFAGYGRQLNLSTRAFVGTGDDILITGFAVAGTKPIRLLIRSVGPTLTAFGVTGALADPALTIVDSGGHVVQTSDNWSSDAANAGDVRAAGAQVGAFELPANSKDAAVVATLPPGSYSIKTTGVGNTTGVAISEVYDLSDADPEGSHLVNLSTRDFVGTGSAILISGFVVDGEIAKTVLIRAIGPTLRVFGLNGTLARPELKIFDSQNRLVATNAGWESAGVSDEIIAAANSVGAFALPRNSADSCLLVVLPPGNYSAQVSGADGGTGTALLEGYELP